MVEFRRVGLAAALIAVTAGCMQPWVEPPFERCRTYAENPTPSAPTSSSIAVQPSRLVVIAAQDHDALLLVDADDLAQGGDARVIARVPVGPAPRHVVVDDARAYVTTGAGDVDVVDLREHRRVRSLPVGEEPVGLVWLEDRRALAVALAGQQAVAIVELHSGEVVRRIELPLPEPRAVAAIGDRLVVGHLVGGMSIVDLRSGEVTVDPLPWTAGVGDGPRPGLEPVAVGVNALTLIGDGVVAVHGLADASVQQTSGSASLCPGYYGSQCSVPGVVASITHVEEAEAADHLGRQGLVSRTTFVPALTAAADSTALAVFVQDGAALTVTVERGRSVGLVGCWTSYYSTLGGHPTPVPIGRGADGLALTAGGDAALVWARFDRTLTRIEAGERYEMLASSSSPLVEEALPVDAAAGRALFFDAVRTSGRDTMSCASCHPEGRADGLTWLTPSGARNTPSLAGGILETAPFHWSGDIPDLAALDVATVQGLMSGDGLSRDERSHLAAFLDWLPPMPTRQRPRELVVRGRELFEDSTVGCLACHPGRHGTDNRNHALLDPRTREPRVAVQTPFLYGVGRTAPYLHDGSVGSLRELVDEWVVSDVMGTGSHLSVDDVAALVAYLESR